MMPQATRSVCSRSFPLAGTSQGIANAANAENAANAAATNAMCQGLRFYTEVM